MEERVELNNPAQISRIEQPVSDFWSMLSMTYSNTLTELPGIEYLVTVMSPKMPKYAAIPLFCDVSPKRDRRARLMIRERLLFLLFPLLLLVQQSQAEDPYLLTTIEGKEIHCSELKYESERYAIRTGANGAQMTIPANRVKSILCPLPSEIEKARATSEKKMSDLEAQNADLKSQLASIQDKAAQAPLSDSSQAVLVEKENDRLRNLVEVMRQKKEQAESELAEIHARPTPKPIVLAVPLAAPKKAGPRKTGRFEATTTMDSNGKLRTTYKETVSVTASGSDVDGHALDEFKNAVARKAKAQADAPVLDMVDPTATPEINPDEVVFLIPKTAKYHRVGCVEVGIRKTIELTRSNAIMAGCVPCDTCLPDAK